MKILLLSDLHSSQEALANIDKLMALEHFHIVLCTGDMTNHQDPRGVEYLEHFIELVKTKHNTELKLVFGNNDDDPVIAYARIRRVLLHFECMNISGERICGIGDFESHPDSHTYQMPDVAGSILMTHRPPLKQLVKSKELSLIKGSPTFHLAGHLHSRAETWQLGATTVIQIPAALDGRYATLELPSNKIQFKWFKESSAS